MGRGQDAAVVAAYDFADAGTVIDVGRRPGRAMLAAILAANPQARGVLLDLPHVAAMARQSVEAAGLSARCHVEAGDFFHREVPHSATSISCAR